jgi:hypothetical protein
MIIDELLTILGFDVKDVDKLDRYVNKVEHAVDELKNMATVATATFAAMLAGVTAINAETAKMANLADAVGMDYEIANTFSGIAKSLGLNSESVIDMFEEMNNKIGESKAIYADWLKGDKAEGKELKLVGGFEDALKGLDLSAVDKSFKGLSLEEKVKKIFSMDSSAQYELFVGAAAVAKDAQVAASSLDILMGGEANKISSQLRNELKRLGVSYEEYKKHKKDLNFLDKEAIESAKEYTRHVGDTTSMFASMGQQISALAGKYLTPIITKMNKWLIINKEIIKVNIDKYIAKAVEIMQRFWNIIKLTWMGIDKMANAMGGWDVVLPILAAIWAYMNPWKMAIVAVLLVFDDLIAYFKGGKSAIGNFINYFKTEFPLLASIIENIGEVFSSVFGLFGALYDVLIKPFFDMFNSDAESSSVGVMASFTDAFSAIGTIVKSALGIISTLFKALTALISGDWETLKILGDEFLGHVIDGFFGLVKFVSAGADIIKKSWTVALDWIMSKIEWVTKKIDSVTSAVSDIGDDISETAGDAWSSTKNFFGFGDDEEKSVSNNSTVNNNTIDRAKETITNVRESVNNNPILQGSINYAPTPAPVTINNNRTITPVHNHNSTYNMNVTGGTTAQETAYAVQEQIIDSKQIEMANITRVVPAYRDS